MRSVRRLPSVALVLAAALTASCGDTPTTAPVPAARSEIALIGYTLLTTGMVQSPGTATVRVGSGGGTISLNAHVLHFSDYGITY